MKRILIALGLTLGTIGALALMRRSGRHESETWTHVQPT